jgi:60 kDa SS-A/Ro ribonucleoprotein
MRFNIFKRKETEVINYEGASAYTMSPEMELYSAVMTCILNDNFYEGANDRLTRIQKLIAKCQPEFVAKLAIYARQEMNLRTVPLVLIVELAKINSGNDIISRCISGVVQRADEITELLAYYQMANKRTDTKKLNRLSKQIQKGLSDSFNRFDEYQFAKYNRGGEVKLKDALFLVHPRANSTEQQVVFDKIAKDELTTPYTWETELSALGSRKYSCQKEKTKAKKEKWEELIFSNKIGYMALMRNLRNILDAEVSAEAIEKVCAYLSNETAVKNSKQLPFRFLSAYRELKVLNSNYVGTVLDALEDAVTISAQNIKGFGLNTSVVIACDVSGSMQKGISPNSKIQLFDIGLMLGMLMQSRCKNVVTGMFGDRWKTIAMSRRNVLSNVMEFYRREGEVGYATNGYLVIEDLIKRQLVVDKIMMFTDVQMWNTDSFSASISTLWKRYKKAVPNAKLYLFDLAGNGTTPIQTKGNDVYLIAGWSDKIFDILDAMDENKNAVEKINCISF